MHTHFSNKLSHLLFICFQFTRWFTLGSTHIVTQKSYFSTLSLNLVKVNLQYFISGLALFHIGAQSFISGLSSILLWLSSTCNISYRVSIFHIGACLSSPLNLWWFVSLCLTFDILCLIFDINDNLIQHISNHIYHWGDRVFGGGSILIKQWQCERMVVFVSSNKRRNRNNCIK